MIQTILDNIRQLQAQITPQPGVVPPDHNPDMLLIGCIDARLDPRKNIGIPDGKALIYRNIGAVVTPNNPSNADRNDQEEALTYAIKEKGVKHIAVMGHTCCGGMNACLCGTDKDFPAIHEHLKPFQGVRGSVIQQGGDQNQQARAMEESCVRQSIENLMGYPVVAEAVKAGTLQLHGWVINTATRRIKEMDPITKIFQPMAVHPNIPERSAEGKYDVIELVRFQQRAASSADLTPPPQSPEILLIGDMDARINPASRLKIPYGKALILRELDPCAEINRSSQESALQFAIQAQKVKDVVLMLHSHSDRYSGATLEEERKAQEVAMRRHIGTLKHYPAVAEALASGQIKLHGWIIDTATKLISEMDLHTGQFKPMAGQGHDVHWADKIPSHTAHSATLSPVYTKNHL